MSFSLALLQNSETFPHLTSLVSSSLCLHFNAFLSPLFLSSLRYNQVLLEHLAWQQQKVRLEKENADLKSILKQYLDGISVPSGAVSGPNPLLVVNYQACLLFLLACCVC